MRNNTAHATYKRIAYTTVTNAELQNARVEYHRTYHAINKHVCTNDQRNNVHQVNQQLVQNGSLYQMQQLS